MYAKRIATIALALALVPASATASQEPVIDTGPPTEEIVAALDELEAGIAEFVDAIEEADATAEAVTAETERLAAELAETEESVEDLGEELGMGDGDAVWRLHRCWRIGTPQTGERQYLCLAGREGVLRPAVRVMRGMHTLVRVLE